MCVLVKITLTVRTVSTFGRVSELLQHGITNSVDSYLSIVLTASGLNTHTHIQSIQYGQLIVFAIIHIYIQCVHNADPILK